MVGTSPQEPENTRIPGLGARIANAVAKWGAEHGVRGLLAFSRAAGISDTALGTYIDGSKEPGAWALLQIASTAHVSIDYLLRGGEGSKVARPSDYVRELLGALRSLPPTADLSRDHQRRYRDFVSYVGTQFRRLVYDTERLLAELHARSQDLRFDADEWRRRWLDSEDDDA